MKKRTKIGGLLFGFLAALGGATYLQMPHTVDASAEDVLAEYYIKNEIIEIPTSTLMYDGTEYVASPIVYYPDGITICDGKQISLTQAGKYTVEYRVKVGNKVLEAYEYFSVKENTYEIDGIKSTIEYGENKQWSDRGLTGLNVKLFEGEKFVYNKKIDLNELSQENKSFLDVIMAPSTLGESDARELHVRLVDAYDASKSVTIRIKRDPSSSGDNVCRDYIDVAVEGEKYYGLHPYANSGTCYIIDNAKYSPHVDNQFGAIAYFSLTGLVHDTYDSVARKWTYKEGVGEKGSLRYDAEEKRIYFGSTLVADLDYEPVCSTYGITPFSGFTTGEVYLEVFGARYSAATDNFCITSIGNEDFEDNVFVSDDAPIITVDESGFENGAIALLNKYFPILSAKATGIGGVDIPVTAEVFYDYYSDHRISIPIENGRFKTERTGAYYIIYTAQNINGQQAEKIVKVLCKDGLQSLSISLGEKVRSGIAGEAIRVADAEVNSYYGDAELRIEAKLKGNPSVTYPIDLSNLSFFPMYAGTYEICYEYSDISEGLVEKYEVEIAATNRAIFMEGIPLPEYFIKGSTYTMPKVDAVGFASGEPQKSSPIIKILEIYEDRTNEVIVSDKYTVANCNELKITYQASSVSNSETYVHTAKVVETSNDEGLDLSQYFQTQEGTFEATLNSSNIAYKTNENGGSKQSLEYIGIVPFEIYSITFRLFKDYANYDECSVYIVDAENENNFLKFTYKNSADGMDLYLNDEYVMNVSTNGATEDIVNTLSFDFENRTYSPMAATNIELPEWFKGFESKYVKTYLELNGIDGEAAIGVQKFMGQTFSKIKMDLIEPTIYTDRVAHYYNYGDLLTFEAAKVFDCIDTDVKCNITIIAPNGNIVTTTAGVVLDEANALVDHEICLNVFGKYSISYVAEDAAGNYTTYSYVFNVVDTVAPIITLKGIVSSGKVGNVIDIAEAAVTDNVTSEVGLFVMILDPNGVLRTFTSDGFVAEKAGVYRICYYAVDDAENTSYVSYEIKVLED